MTQDQIREIVSQYYVTKSDRTPIEKFTMGHPQYALSFRMAGEDTIRRLMKSAGAKPHDILEKSIKLPYNAYELGRLNLNDAENKENEQYISMIATSIGAREDNKKAAFNMVKGFVGHWKVTKNDKGKDTKSLTGIYLTDYGANELKKKTECRKSIGTITTNNKTRSYLCLSSISSTNGVTLTPFDFSKLPTLGKEKDWEQYFFTGDYDLHDNWVFCGQTFPVIEGTHDYNLFITQLNEKLNTSAQLKSEVKNDPDYNRIQHGSQFGYIAFMVNNEINKKEIKPITLPEKVAKWNLPLAFCSKGVWTLITTKEEYNSFYASIGAHVKSSWNSEANFDSFSNRFNSIYSGRAEISK